MRAVRLPPRLAVYPDAWHCLVLATNASDSYRQFVQRCANEGPGPALPCASADANDGGAASQATSLAEGTHDERVRDKEMSGRNGEKEGNNSQRGDVDCALPFRLHNLLATDWSQLLRLCRALTDPQKSYTFSSPGDGTPCTLRAQLARTRRQPRTTNPDSPAIATIAEDGAALRGVANRAFLHIVERVAKDFVPNNMIYYALRRYDAADVPLAASTSEMMCAASPNSRVASTNMDTLPGQGTGSHERRSATSATSTGGAETSDRAASASFDEFLCALQEGQSLPDMYRHDTSSAARAPHAALSSTSASFAAQRTSAANSITNDTDGQDAATQEESRGDAEAQDCYMLPFTCAAVEERRSCRQKCERDPLFHLDEARRLSAQNVQVMLPVCDEAACADSRCATGCTEEVKGKSDKASANINNGRDEAAREASRDATHPRTFAFYPHAVEAAACMPYRSRYFGVLVNLKPIVPFHLMVVPLRCVGTIHGLTPDEVADWGGTMTLTIRVLEAVRRVRNLFHAGSQGQPRRSDTSHLMDVLPSAAEALRAMRGAVSTTSLAGRAHDGGYSFAIQQGAQAGQTVAHLHTHVIPYDPYGKLAGEPEPDEETEARRRVPRTAEEMRRETEWLRGFFDRLGGKL